MAKSIIVVDDQESMLEIIKLVLETDEYEVRCVTNSKAMMREIKKQMPALIILDIYLHQEYGGDIARRLKKSPSMCGIPVLLISADANIFEVYQHSGADGYIAKPFDIQVLLAKVRQLIKP